MANWGIWSDLKGTKRFIRSGSAGPSCPASPENKFSKWFDHDDWQFNKASGEGKEEWEEGGVIISCSVHGQSCDV